MSVGSYGMKHLEGRIKGEWWNIAGICIICIAFSEGDHMHGLLDGKRTWYEASYPVERTPVCNDNDEQNVRDLSSYSDNQVMCLLLLHS